MQQLLFLLCFSSMWSSQHTTAHGQLPVWFRPELQRQASVLEAVHRSPLACCCCCMRCCVLCLTADAGVAEAAGEVARLPYPNAPCLKHTRRANPAYPELVVQLALDIANGIKWVCVCVSKGLRARTCVKCAPTQANACLLMPHMSVLCEVLWMTEHGNTESPRPCQRRSSICASSPPSLSLIRPHRYMHSLRVLHMDLKAENILLTHSNSAIAPAHSRLGGLTAKVSDRTTGFTPQKLNAMDLGWHCIQSVQQATLI